MERRNDERHEVWIPVRLGEVRGGLAMTHNVSTTGVLMVTAGTAEVGAPVTITLRAPPENPVERTLHGRVIRVEPNEADPHGLWPHRMAVAFDDPDPELEELLSAFEEREKSQRPPPKE